MAGTERGKLTRAVEYDILHRKVAEKVVLTYKLRGLPVPELYRDPPEVMPWQDIFLTAWNQLNEERTPGPKFTDVVRIGRAQVKGWLVWKGWQDDRDFAEDLLFYIQRLEDMFIPIEARRRVRLEAKQKRKETPKPRKGRRR